MPTKRLPPNVELALWVLLANFYVWRLGMLPTAWMDLPFLPFIEVIDHIPSAVLSIPLVGILLISPLAIILRYRPTLFSLLLGLTVLFMVVASRPLYSTNLLFHGCLFVLIGLYRGNPLPFRWQLILLYAAAGLNKALLPDWWTGQYITFFAEEFLSSGNFFLDTALRYGGVAKVLGWLTIAVELLVLPLLLLRNRTVGWAILVGWSFHAGMLVITFGQLSLVYLYLVSAAYLLLFPLPTTARNGGFFQRYRYQLVAAIYFGGLLLWLKWDMVAALFANLR